MTPPLHPSVVRALAVPATSTLRAHGCPAPQAVRWIALPPTRLHLDAPDAFSFEYQDSGPHGGACRLGWAGTIWRRPAGGAVWHRGGWRGVEEYVRAVRELWALGTPLVEISTSALVLGCAQLDGAGQ